MIGIIKDENQTIESFLHFNELYSLLKCEKIYNDKDEIIDKNKALKDYGFHNGDRYKFDRLHIGGGAFTENKFFDNIVLSDLIKENNQNVLEIYSPSGEVHYPMNIIEEMSFDVIGSNTGPVFGGKHGRYSLDSNICKAAVFEGKVSIGQKALVHLKIIKNNNCFEGDTRNGITTSDSRNISDLCFVFTGKVFPESYYHPKRRLIKC